MELNKWMGFAEVKGNMMDNCYIFVLDGRQ